MNKKQADKTYSGLRTSSLYIKLADAEKAAIIAGAKRAKLSQSDYIMALVRKDAQEYENEERQYFEAMEQAQEESEELERRYDQLYYEEQEAERHAQEIWASRWEHNDE